jgi:hypothetical protein
MHLLYISYSLTAVVSSQMVTILTQNGEMKVEEVLLVQELMCLLHAVY